MTRSRAVLLVHGAGGGGWEWNVWRGVLEAAGFQVAAPDLVPLRGDVAATRLQDYQAQVRAALAALPRPRVLVGASLGGLLALDAASFLRKHSMRTKPRRPSVLPCLAKCR